MFIFYLTFTYGIQNLASNEISSNTEVQSFKVKCTKLTLINANNGYFYCICEKLDFSMQNSFRCDISIIYLTEFYHITQSMCMF